MRWGELKAGIRRCILPGLLSFLLSLRVGAFLRIHSFASCHQQGSLERPVTQLPDSSRFLPEVFLLSAFPSAYSFACLFVLGNKWALGFVSPIRILN